MKKGNINVSTIALTAEDADGTNNLTVSLIHSDNETFTLESVGENGKIRSVEITMKEYHDLYNHLTRFTGQIFKVLARKVVEVLEESKKNKK